MIDSMYQNRFENERYTLKGYCPHCDEAILSNHDNVKVNDDYFHMECYENFKSIMEEE